MSKRTRALLLGVTLAAMNLAGMTTVAHAQAIDQQATRRPPTERQVGEPWRHQVASPAQAAADTAHRRQTAQEQSYNPRTTPRPGARPRA